MLRAGMSRPTTTEDGWWLAILWVADDEGVVPFVDLAPRGRTAPEPPLALLGPSLAGALSGLILEDAGRLSHPARTVVPRRRPDPAVAGAGRGPRGVPLGADASRRDAPERARRDGPRGLPAGRSRAFGRP